jgi:hypothetical protein
MAGVRSKALALKDPFHLTVPAVLTATTLSSQVKYMVPSSPTAGPTAWLQGILSDHRF